MNKRGLLLILSAPVMVCALLALTFAVFQVPVLQALQALAAGSVGDWFGISRTLVKMTPLLLIALGMVVAWRAGAFNIGGEGQFILGGLGGAGLAKVLLAAAPPPTMAFQLAILLVATLSGGLWAVIAGWAFSRRGVPVVITTILLNFIAYQVLAWSVDSPLREASGRLPLSDQLPESLMLGRFDAQADAHAGVLVALVAVPFIYFLLKRTAFGYAIRLVGANPNAARTAHIDPARTQVLALALSGSFCGLAGGIEYLGVSGQLGSTFAQGWGFVAVPVALLGGLQPFFVALSALVFGALFAGTEHVGRFAAGGPTMVFVAQGAAVLGFVALARWQARRPAAA